MSVNSLPATNGAIQPASVVATPGKRTTRRAKIPKLKRRDFIRVKWVDAVTEYGPKHSDDDFPCPIRYTIGHFIKRDDVSLTLAMEDDSEAGLVDSDCQTVTSIPLGMIRGVTVLVPKE